jgi:hypothetical protein
MDGLPMDRRCSALFAGPWKPILANTPLQSQSGLPENELGGSQ